MTNFSSLRDLCLRLFGAPNLSAEHIVDIWVDDAASVWPHGSEGVRVAFTLTYDGVNRLDGPTHSALMDLLGAGGDEPRGSISERPLRYYRSGQMAGVHTDCFSASP